MRNYMFKREMAFRAAGERLCQCGHPRHRHQEYQADRHVSVVNGVIDVKVTPHPKYRPLLFACQENGCNCEVDRG